MVWVEAEAFTDAEGLTARIEPDTPDYGFMARAAASGQAFVRFAETARLTLPEFETPEAAEWVVWVRAFPITGRAVTVAVGGADVGSTQPDSATAALIWMRLGSVRLEAGRHSLQLRGAEGNTGWPYVDVVALMDDPTAIPFGSSPADIIRGEPVQRVHEDFSAASVEGLGERWVVSPPPGADAIVEMAPGEDDGALHVHNGTAQPWTLTSRVPLAIEPGQQLAVRLRVRKATLMEYITIVVPQVGAFSPQVYKSYQTSEYAWIV
ncbi:MAG TPA: hypothetical protein VM283_03155, partial [Armatimonadota bacterium]|nr:hypothetical protein [Armatimonadota bacterium]